MDIELGIQNVARPINFSTDETEEAVSDAIAKAIASNGSIDLTDSKGRRIIVPASTFAYAVIGSQTKHAVGFGSL